VNGRQAFILIASAVMLIIFVAIVILPGVARGGVAEIIGVVGIIAAVLLFERWLRRAMR
jgi:hypothetical protein